MHFKSDNRENMIGNDEAQIIEGPSDPLIQKHQIGFEESVESSVLFSIVLMLCCANVMR